MTDHVLHAVRAYLLLSEKNKLEFLNQISEIEQMPSAVRMDYKKSLLARGVSQKQRKSLAGEE